MTLMLRMILLRWVMFLLHGMGRTICSHNKLMDPLTFESFFAFLESSHFY